MVNYIKKYPFCHYSFYSQRAFFLRIITDPDVSFNSLEESVDLKRGQGNQHINTGNQDLSQASLKVFPESGIPSRTIEPGPLSWLYAYNIVWTTPGEKAIHSMPIGGGNIALNVWSTDNELLLYIGSPDSWVDGDIALERSEITLWPLRWMDPEWDVPRYPTFYDTMDFNLINN